MADIHVDIDGDDNISEPSVPEEDPAFDLPREPIDEFEGVDDENMNPDVFDYE